MKIHKLIYGQVLNRNLKELIHIDVNFINLIMYFKEKKLQKLVLINYCLDN